MNIDAIINTSERGGQIEAAANSRQETANRTPDEQASHDRISLSASYDFANKDKGAADDSKKTPPIIKRYDLKAVFALDDDKNVVVRFLDKKGKTVAQFPPEEYLDMVKKLNEVVDNLYSKKV